MRLRPASIIARASLPILTRMDPEMAHDLGLAGLRCLARVLPAYRAVDTLKVRCFGLEFANPVGLAAGFDKNGDYVDALGAVGFGHLELGTVTPRRQAGNPKPRMFRIPEARALINRMGFNNEGVDHLAERLPQCRYPGIRGISIGKNAGTPIENAADDYVACLRKIYGLADYVAVNVSSPNTARLRELQAREGLDKIVGALLEERAALEARFGRRVPLLVKIAPDLEPEQISALSRDLRALDVDGVIATNTTLDKSMLDDAPAARETGGLSGAPLHRLSVRVIAQLRAELGAEFPIIGVGGISSAADACATLAAGANLIQTYTGFAYRGPALIDEILGALSNMSGLSK